MLIPPPNKNSKNKKKTKQNKITNKQTKTTPKNNNFRKISCVNIKYFCTKHFDSSDVYVIYDIFQNYVN